MPPSRKKEPSKGNRRNKGTVISPAASEATATPEAPDDSSLKTFSAENPTFCQSIVAFLRPSYRFTLKYQPTTSCLQPIPMSALEPSEVSYERTPMQEVEEEREVAPRIEERAVSPIHEASTDHTEVRHQAPGVKRARFEEEAVNIEVKREAIEALETEVMLVEYDDDGEDEVDDLDEVEEVIDDDRRSATSEVEDEQSDYEKKPRKTRQPKRRTSSPPMKRPMGRIMKGKRKVQQPAKSPSKERRFRCLVEDCEETFLQDRDRLRHMNGHMAPEWPCPNPDCKGVFTRRDALVRHVNTMEPCSASAPRKANGNFLWEILDNDQSNLWQTVEGIKRFRACSPTDPMAKRLAKLREQYRLHPWVASR